MDNKTEIFLEYKALLFSMAYNMLGNIDAAEDIVQDSFIKWTEVRVEAVVHTKAFLVKMVTNSCINYLNSARVQREQYIGIWLPEPLQDYAPDKAHKKMETYHALSIGMMVLLEKLTRSGIDLQSAGKQQFIRNFRHASFFKTAAFREAGPQCRRGGPYRLLLQTKDHLP